MTNPSDKDQDIKAWNNGAFPASGGAVLPSFDDICFLFTSYATTVAEWKDRYRGATYATRLKAAIADMKFAMAEAERHPEIAPPQTASNEAMVALALAVSHLDHMAAWITEANSDRDVGIYSFESLGEDMPGIRAALRLAPAAPVTEAAARWLERARATQCCDMVIDGLLGQAIEIISAIPHATEVGVREALEFYADDKRYNGPNIRRTPDDPYTAADAAYMKDVTRDGGDIARRALAALRTPPAVAARSGVGGS